MHARVHVEVSVSVSTGVVVGVNVGVSARVSLCVRVRVSPAKIARDAIGWCSAVLPLRADSSLTVASQ